MQRLSASDLLLNHTVEKNPEKPDNRKSRANAEKGSHSASDDAAGQRGSATGQARKGAGEQEEAKCGRKKTAPVTGRRFLEEAE